MLRSDSLKFCGVVESPPTPGSLTALLQFHNVVEIAADAPIGQPVDDFHSDVATAVVNLLLIAADVAIGQLQLQFLKRLMPLLTGTPLSIENGG